jgi:hypothetical protein
MKIAAACFATENTGHRDAACFSPRSLWLIQPGVK